MNPLYIAIDPGFDSLKVIANGIAFKFPFNVVETDERKMSDYALRDDFLLYQNRLGITYRVGQYAREMIFENKLFSEDGMQDFYTEQRFISDSFSVGLDVAIALSIIKSGLYLQQDSLDIHLIVALPHACRNQFASTIIGKASGPHVFNLRCGTHAEQSFEFSILSENIKTVSQTIAAILGETSDEYGNIDAEKSHYLTQGPTLVLDGGYYTFGMVVVSRGGSVDDNLTESDTAHAMKNVNLKIASAVSDVRPDVKHYAIEYLLSKDNGMLRYIKDGHAECLSLPTIREEKLQEVCLDFIQYLNQKYNSLLDVRYVLVTGGTGACFYPQMLQYYTQTGIMDESHFLLTHSSLNEKNFPIEYAIAIGAYKGLKGTT